MTPQRLGRYELLQEIGRGGMAVVFRARDERLGTQVAVKVLPQLVSANDEAVARFEREARAASLVEHPGVARLLDVGSEGGRRYLVFELLTGGTLEDRIKIEGALPWRTAVRHAAAVAHALGALHRANLIHRDVKPANVLLDRDGLPRLADFGLAHATDAKERLTRSGDVVGTPAYLSPEQADARPVDFRTDLHGLGALLFALLTGRPPFQGEGLNLLKNVLTKVPPDVRTFAADVPANVAALVARLLAKEVSARGGSADDVAAELEAVLVRESSRTLPVVAGLLAVATAVLAALLALATGPSSSTLPVAPPVPRPPVPVPASGPPRGEPLLRVETTWGSPALSHPSEVTAVAFVDSGRLLAGTASSDLVLWDLATREPSGIALETHGPVTALSVHGGLALASQGQTGDISLVALDRRSVVRQCLGKVGTQAVFVPDGRQFFFAVVKGGMNVVDTVGSKGETMVSQDAPLKDARAIQPLSSGELLAADGALGHIFGRSQETFTFRLGAPIVALAVDRAERRFAFGLANGNVSVNERGAQSRLEWHAHDGAVHALAFTADGRSLVTASADPGNRSAALWRLSPESAEQAGAFVGHGGAEFTSIALSPDGKRIAMGNSDRSIGVFDVETLKEVGVERAAERGPAHRAAVLSIALSPEGSEAVSVGHDRVVRVWETGTGASLVPTHPQGGSCPAAIFAPGTKRVLVAVATGALESFTPGSSQVRLLDRPRVLHESIALGLAPGPPGKVFELRADKIYSTDAETGAATLVITSEEPSPPLRLIARSASSPLLGGDGRGDLVFIDTDSNMLLARRPAHAGAVRALAVAPTGGRALSAGDDGTLVVWDVSDASERNRVLVAGGAVTAIAFASKDGARVLVGVEDGSLRLLDTDSLRELARLEGKRTDAPTAIAVAPDFLRAFVGRQRGVIERIALR